MRSIIAPLFGFAVFGAIFAAVYYDADFVERELEPPRFRLGPGDTQVDLIWDSGRGENITANITVLSGGPVDLYVVDVDHLSSFVLNGTQYGFEVQGLKEHYHPGPSLQNITQEYNLTFLADGETRWYFVYVSRMAEPDGYDEMTNEERAAYLTELAVSIRYVERESRSLVLGYLFAIPSLLLVAVALRLSVKRRNESPPPQGGLRFPADKDL